MVSILSMNFVGNLAVIFDDSLNFVKHINLLVRDFNYHMRNVDAVRRHWDRSRVVTISYSLSSIKNQFL